MFGDYWLLIDSRLRDPLGSDPSFIKLEILRATIKKNLIAFSSVPGSLAGN